MAPNWLTVILYSVSVVLLFTLVYLDVKPPKLHHRLQFHRIFGYWPIKDDRLRTILYNKVIEPELVELANALWSAVEDQKGLLRDAESEKVNYSTALRSIRNADSQIRQAQKRFKTAISIVGLYGWEVHEDYTDYLPKPLEEPERSRVQGVAAG